MTTENERYHDHVAEALEDIIEDNSVKEDYAIDIDRRYKEEMSAPHSSLSSHNREKESNRVISGEKDRESTSVISHNAVSCANPVGWIHVTLKTQSELENVFLSSMNWCTDNIR